MSGPQLDAELRTALDRYGRCSGPASTSSWGLRAPPKRLRGSARSCSSTATSHVARGARAGGCYQRWRELVEPGGDLLFHDAVDGVRMWKIAVPGSRRCAWAEIEAGGASLERQVTRGARSRTSSAASDAARRGGALSYNGREDTLAALESLRQIKFVVVDNGSSDGSAEAVAERSRTSSWSGPASTSASRAATTSGSGGRSTGVPTGSSSSTTTPRSNRGSSRRWPRRRPRGRTRVCWRARCSSPTPTGSGTPGRLRPHPGAQPARGLRRAGRAG